MNKVNTLRLELIPCSYEIGKMIEKDRDELKKAAGIDIPDDWPLEDLRDFLPVYLDMLQSDPSQLEWGIWLIVHKNEQKIIGDIGFKGKPDAEGKVEIGYSVIPDYRRKDYCYEASVGLVNWAFQQTGVNKVSAECDKDNLPSFRILEKLHMSLKNQSEQRLYWELAKATWEDFEIR